MKSAVKFFIKNYKLTLILSGFLFVYGLQGLKSMVAEKFPAVSLATAIVVTIYPGASADDIETKITKVLEDEMKGVVGIKDISSISKSGLSTITVRVDMDNYNVADVMEELQKKVNGVAGLPTDLSDKPEFTEINSAELPVFIVALVGPNDKRQRDLTADDLKEVFEDIAAVKSVTLGGHGEREFQIKLNPKALGKNYISISEVINKIQAHNVNIPGGSLKEGNDEALLRVEGKIKNVEDLKNFVIRSNFTGSVILLKDIAEVLDGQEEKRVITRFNGKPATILTVVKKEGEDTLKMVAKVKERLKEFKKEKIEKEIDIEIMTDESVGVSNKLSILSFNAVTGLILVIAFLFIFLPFKIGIAASISLPLAVMATFGVMPYFGMNLDSITILALIISIGMLVDNSVIISETYTRLVEDGMPPEEAAAKAVNDLWGAITASALTTIAAFLPMLVTKGIMGAFITSIPIIVTASLILSLGESFFLLPMRLSKIAKNIKKAKNKKSGPYAKFEAFFNGLVSACVNRRYLVLLGFVGVVTTSAFFLGVMNKFILFPSEETEYYIGRFEAPAGSTLENTDILGGRLSQAIKRKLGDKVLYVTSTAGEQRNGLDDSKGGDGANLGLVKIRVNDDTKYNVSYLKILADLKSIDTPYLAKVSFEEIVNGPPVGSAIESRFRSNDAKKLDQMLKLVMADMHKVEGVTDLKIDDVVGQDEIFVHIDFEQADRVGLSAEQIGSTIRAAISGSTISQVTLANFNIKLRVRLQEEYRENIKDLENLKILNNQRKLVRLGTVVRFERKAGGRQIKRFKGRRARSIVGNVNTDIITEGKANKILLESFKKHRNEVKGVSLYQSGAAESSAESIESLGSASILAGMAIFALLVFMFNSYLKPFIILTTIPLGLLGFSIAFYLHGRPISFLAIIGVIGLAGMIVNSGIVLIDYIDVLKKKYGENADMPKLLTEAATTRLRPVLVTSLTTISGLFPTAYALGGSDSMLIPLTLAMAWGLTTGTILTLVWIPCAYGILEDWGHFLKRKKVMA